MLYVILSFVFFILSILGHILLHRYLLKKGVRNYRSIYILASGFLLTLLILVYISTIISSNSWWNVSLPISASLIYALLSFLYYIYFSNAYVGEDSPSSRIYYHLKNGAKTYKEIISYFSDASLVVKRLRNLVDADLIVYINGVYVVKWRGKLIMFIFEIYRKILGWNKGG